MSTLRLTIEVLGYIFLGGAITLVSAAAWAVSSADRNTKAVALIRRLRSRRG